MELLDFRRGGPLDPPRLLPPLPEKPGPAGGWLTDRPPEPPWLVAMWGATCWYCKKGLVGLAPVARRLDIPLVALHVPEFPADEAEGHPERVLDELGLPHGTEGIYVHRDARAWAELVAMRYWPTFLVVDRDRRATYVLIGWAGEDRYYREMVEALERARADAR
ncbi:MAG: hypothetical protein DIU72_001215 [Pseudomonadota bacterium]